MKCSVADCGLCQNKNRPNGTYHRLPRNESRQRKWLEQIGVKNIRPGNKNIYVCSLHFEENAFNKTLNVLRLRDDAIPTIFAKKADHHPPQLALKNRTDKKNTMNQPSCSDYLQDARDLKLAAAHQELKKMKEKVYMQNKIIKCLNKVVRQQNFKLDIFKNFIIEIKKKN